ncbi:MAG: BamA/TamA family outer membrane protein [Megasphaera sp.]|nr:BamA/TamA family outer membrane protein [Megasphaera sp.]
MNVRRPATMLAMAVMTSLIASGTIYAAPAETQMQSGRFDGYNDSGVEMSRTRQYFEQQQAQQRIAEGRETSKVEGEGTTATENESNAVRFVLKGVETTQSEVLKTDEIQDLAAPYIGKEISLTDLYTLVGKINELYSKKGYVTCKAFLRPQTIKDGIVHIDLVEGKTENVAVEGNKTTRSSYIRDRVSLKEGKIANISQLNKDLLRFNATNDAQLRISMKAGEAYGTTDYVITAYEPQRDVFGIFSDNAGNDTSGLYRGGFWWQDRSLTGNRDSLFLSTVFSKGTKAGSAAYTIPIDNSGTKFGFGYSANSVHIIDGPLEPLNVKGHSYSYNFNLTHPLVTTETLRSELGLTYDYQHSQTDFAHIHWINDKIRSFGVFYDQTNYGKTAVFYQKHGYRFGSYTNIYDRTRHYGKYTLNTLYQKSFPSGQMWTIRMEGQLSSTQYLPSAEMFYIGGMYSVRGYTESLLGGDGGVSASVEYSVPLTKSKRTSAYIFLDGGRVWGDSAFGDRSLIGTGFGIKTNIQDHAYINIGMGFPLIRTINNAEQSRARVHFSFNSQF